MISFSSLDIIIILFFFALLLLIGFISSKKTKSTSEDYLLSGRKVGLFLFVLISVSTWYGGIIGVGEFTYRYGLVSWFTQGFPYYFFAFLFAIFFAKKIRAASLFTIPEKLTEVYGKKVGLISAIVVFILVSPAPYLLMSANLISLVFDTNIFISLLIGIILSGSYLIKGGFRSNIYADAFQFFVMFIGFILIFVVCLISFGGIDFLQQNLPSSHLKITGDASPTFLIVWFLIALWTFADPGFHQRAYAARTGNVARNGILISIIFFALFDFLTTSTGLFAHALIPNLDQPVNAFPLLAEKILSPGLKGIFYAAMFATIISTLNSFLFLSATTIGRDFIFKIIKNPKEEKVKTYTVIGILISGAISIIIAYSIPSVVEIWYTIGSLFIPGIILPVISSYYPRIRISSGFILLEIVTAIVISSVWYLLRNEFTTVILFQSLEPMIVGLFVSVIIHSIGLVSKSSSFD
ncbi:MAG: sodium:solute symporter family protein [Ignavibacteriaceae bacterium]|nr:sodium:solute symporter family protein [Ignavibacterium sp.]MCC6254660.1 sodium:solute symporter family protein [Ignavibacteriaceae bacterium]HRN25224.1 sodium:solute symporter family protein [Ignavibacteriaceae bacterium]HRP93540.1 sodium:solute symporter family protein [Ignavibacteriaceae bacterium]HRQ52958.1 sodium:solute symporter family protein [Ignavibacteriaceae bacterium]